MKVLFYLISDMHFMNNTSRGDSMHNLFTKSDNELVSAKEFLEAISKHAVVELINALINSPRAQDSDTSEILLFHKIFELGLNKELGPKIALLNEASERTDEILVHFGSSLTEKAHKKQIPVYREFSQKWDTDTNIFECPMTKQINYYKAGDLKSIFTTVCIPPEEIKEMITAHTGITAGRMRNLDELMRRICEGAINSIQVAHMIPAQWSSLMVGNRRKIILAALVLAVGLINHLCKRAVKGRWIICR
jgi:hypothetical protein